MRGRVLSSYPPLALVVLLGGFRLTMKSDFFQPSFSKVRRSSLHPHIVCSTRPAPRTSRSERFLVIPVDRRGRRRELKITYKGTHNEGKSFKNAVQTGYKPADMDRT